MSDYFLTGLIIATIFIINTQFSPGFGMLLQQLYPDVRFDNPGTYRKVVIMIVIAWPAMLGMFFYALWERFFKK